MTHFIYHYGYQITLDNMDIFQDLFLRGKKETLKIFANNENGAENCEPKIIFY